MAKKGVGSAKKGSVHQRTLRTFLEEVLSLLQIDLLPVRKFFESLLVHLEQLLEVRVRQVLLPDVPVHGRVRVGPKDTNE